MSKLYRQNKGKICNGVKKRVVVAMSGGVDSSVAAHLLLKQGYEVIGISLKLFENTEQGRACHGIKGINDARDVAFKLGAPFYALNCVKEFKKNVIDYFCQEYKNARTPNPCTICNEKIKFGLLLKKAKTLGADYIATGHYAGVSYDKSSERYILKRPKDKTKDQTYFLYALTQNALKHTLFPLENLTKDQVRKIAKKSGIKVHDKPASQEICFVPDNNYKEFLIKKYPDTAEPGPIINRQGQVLGKHKGIIFYTVGQREGLGIAHKKPLYVLAINKGENTIIVGEQDETYASKLIAANVNWIINGISNSVTIEAKPRYKEPSAEAMVSKLDNNKAEVEFIKAQSSIAPGQAIVFYKKGTVVGGGIIDKVIK